MAGCPPPWVQLGWDPRSPRGATPVSSLTGRGAETEPEQGRRPPPGHRDEGRLGWPRGRLSHFGTKYRGRGFHGPGAASPGSGAGSPSMWCRHLPHGRGRGPERTPTLMGVPHCGPHPPPTAPKGPPPDASPGGDAAALGLGAQTPGPIGWPPAGSGWGGGELGLGEEPGWQAGWRVRGGCTVGPGGSWGARADLYPIRQAPGRGGEWGPG